MELLLLVCSGASIIASLALIISSNTMKSIFEHANESAMSSLCPCCLWMILGLTPILSLHRSLHNTLKPIGFPHCKLVKSEVLITCNLLKVAFLNRLRPLLLFYFYLNSFSTSTHENLNNTSKTSIYTNAYEFLHSVLFLSLSISIRRTTCSPLSFLIWMSIWSIPLKPMPLLPIISCHHHCYCMLRFDIIVLLVTFVVTAAASSVNEAIITGVPMT